MKQELSLNNRNIALTMVMETLEDKRLSHYVVNDTFKEKPWINSGAELKRDKDFIMTIFMGTIEKLVYIDYVINNFSSIKIEKMKPVIRNILRISIYQLYFMDSVPDRAALSEAQKLCEIRKFNGLKGFVNGVLRAAVRRKDELKVPEHIAYFSPEWLYNLVVDQYGKELAEEFFKTVNNKESKISAKLNTNSIHSDEIIKSLEKDGCEVTEMTDVKNGVFLREVGSVTDLEAYKKGWIYIQDVNSMKIAECCDLISPKLILDVCAAPGGKSIDLAIEYPNAAIVSRDINENKKKLIDENIKRMGLVNVQTQVVDATKATPELNEKADLVVADLPCSGLGVINKKPDIKIRVRKEDLDSLSRLQRDILTAVQSYVKPGGLLIFSTCTINKGENEENAIWLKENFDFKLESMTQLVPGREEGDGFFIAKFIKNQ